MKVVKFIVSLLIPLAAGGIGTLATMPNIPTWYSGLEKPFLNPPSFVFGPVWTTLYILIGISFYLVWTRKSSKSKKSAYIIFGTQIVLNTLWSIVFFGLHQPWLAAVVIGLLIISIISNIVSFHKFSRIAAYLLVPYLLWVSFATYLNISIAILN